MSIRAISYALRISARLSIETRPTGERLDMNSYRNRIEETLGAAARLTRQLSAKMTEVEKAAIAHVTVDGILMSHQGIEYHAFLAGAAWQREQDAKLCDRECEEYQKSMEEFDRRGNSRMGTNEARCAVTAQFLAERIRAQSSDERCPTCQGLVVPCPLTACAQNVCLCPRACALHPGDECFCKSCVHARAQEAPTQDEHNG